MRNKVCGKTSKLHLKLFLVTDAKGPVMFCEVKLVLIPSVPPPFCSPRTTFNLLLCETHFQMALTFYPSSPLFHIFPQECS